MKLSIDRFEGNYAVCEDNDGKMHDIPRELVQESAKEGDVLIFRDGSYWVDTEETQKRRNAAAQLQKKLMDG